MEAECDTCVQKQEVLKGTKITIVIQLKKWFKWNSNAKIELNGTPLKVCSPCFLEVRGCNKIVDGIPVTFEHEFTSLKKSF